MLQLNVKMSWFLHSPGRKQLRCHNCDNRRSCTYPFIASRKSSKELTRSPCMGAAAVMNVMFSITDRHAINIRREASVSSSAAISRACVCVLGERCAVNGILSSWASQSRPPHRDSLLDVQEQSRECFICACPAVPLCAMNVRLPPYTFSRGSHVGLNSPNGNRGHRLKNTVGHNAVTHICRRQRRSSEACIA
jgi:hypothetical protein